jgi:excisionase family DNA binding protein
MQPRTVSGDGTTGAPRVTISDRLLTISEVAAYLNVPVGTMYQWRHRGVGPVGLRVGRHVRYRMRDLDRWLDNLSAGTSPPVPARRRR